MGPQGRRRFKRFLVSSSVAIAATALAGLIFGQIAAVVLGAAGFLGVAVVSDDKAGTCLIVAVLFLIVLVLLSLALFAAVWVNV
jgi:hypothetical protein